MWYVKFLSCVLYFQRKLVKVSQILCSLVRPLISYLLVSPQFSGLAGLVGSFIFAIVNLFVILVC
jgi:hypothetical protein